MTRAVLITGGTGFLGAAVVRELLERGDAVHVFARPTADRGALADCDVTWHAGDVLDAGSLERALARTREAAGQDPFVVHSAAVISYRTRDRDLQRQVNVGGTRNVLAAARRIGVARVVHVSSVVAVGFAPVEKGVSARSTRTRRLRAAASASTT